jgi:hypothetical protein
VPGPKRATPEERFAGYLVPHGDDECWGWTGPFNGQGYPTVGRGGKGAGQMSARRLAYQLAFGAAPEGEVVVTCGTTVCLNPRHLLLRSEQPDKTLRKRFEQKVGKGGQQDCWPWTGKPNGRGYGQLSAGRANGPLLAHRLAWEFAFGPVPSGVLVRQSCGNRLCCNPAHLFLAMNTTDTPEQSERAVRAWLEVVSPSGDEPVTSDPVDSPCS